jgi:hypothetical protein
MPAVASVLNIKDAVWPKCNFFFWFLLLLQAAGIGIREKKIFNRNGWNMSAIQLYKEHPETYKREILGSITEGQLDFLINNLEEEFEEDEECFLSPETLDYLRSQGADKVLIALLESALAGSREGIDIGYVIG